MPAYLSGGNIDSSGYDSDNFKTKISGSASCMMDQTVYVRGKMTVRKQMYLFNLDGIKSYMRNLQNNRMDVYTALKPDLDDLDGRTFSGNVIYYGGMMVGTGITGLSVLLSLTVSQEKIESASGTAYRPNLGLMLGGTLVGLNTFPKDDEYYNFINKHNRLNNENPINIELGYDYRLKGFGGTLAVQF